MDAPTVEDRAETFAGFGDMTTEWRAGCDDLPAASMVDSPHYLLIIRDWSFWIKVGKCSYLTVNDSTIFINSCSLMFDDST